MNNMQEALKCPDGLGNAFINLRIGQCFFEQGNFEQAKNYLLQAYIIDGLDVFENEETKYLDFLDEENLLDVEDEYEENYNQHNNNDNEYQEIATDYCEQNKKIEKNKILDYEIEQKINKLGSQIKGELEAKNYNKIIEIRIKQWDLLPEDKVSYEYSYEIIVGIIKFSVKSLNLDIMKEWIPLIFKADLLRIDDGDRELWAGIVAYELGGTDKALEYFKIANKKMYGIVFRDGQQKYKDFYYKNK